MRTSAQITEQIEGLHVQPRSVRSRVLALEKVLAQRELQMAAALIQTGGHDPDHVGNAESTVWNLAQYGVMTELLNGRAALAMLKESAPYIEAVQVLDPLFEELAEALAAEEAERLAISEAELALKAATKEAETKLLAKVDSDPAVKKAKEDLAALNPPPKEEVKPEPSMLEKYNGTTEDPARELQADLH